MPTRKIKTFVACGAAAGISAVFNTPIAGVFFAIEVLLGELRPRSFAFVVISSAAAWLTARTLMAEETLFEVRPWEFQHSWEFFLWVILGTIAAALGRLFVVVLYRTENFFDRLRLSPMLRPALGGLAVGIVGIAFPHVFGSGYKPMSAALNGTVFTRLGILHPGPLEENLDEILVPVLSPDGLGARLIDQLGAVPILHAILLLGMLALAKMLATSLTLGSGGSGGVFAPSLFIGGLFGAAFGLLLQIILPGQTGPPGAYALLGMAATFSAAAHAPVTAILITFEITNYNEAMVPGLMVSSVVAILLAYRLAGDSIYTVKFKRLGLRIGDSQARDPMKQIQVRDAMATEFFTMPLTMTIREAQLYAETVGQRAYPVVGKSETDLAGLITVYDLNLAVAGNRPDDTPIRDIMDPSPPTSTPDEYLDRAFKILEESEAAMLPILATGQQRLIGILTHATMVRAYTEYQLNRE
jgi:CIC family chloride channel protein